MNLELKKLPCLANVPDELIVDNEGGTLLPPGVGEWLLNEFRTKGNIRLPPIFIPWPVGADTPVMIETPEHCVRCEREESTEISGTLRHEGQPICHDCESDARMEE